MQTDDGEDDLKKGTQLLEIYALEIQMYTEQKNNKKLKVIYNNQQLEKYAFVTSTCIYPISICDKYISGYFHNDF